VHFAFWLQQPEMVPLHTQLRIAGIPRVGRVPESTALGAHTSSANPMTESATQFQNELDALVNRHSQEGDLTVGEAVQILEWKKLELFVRYFHQAVKEGEDDKQ
jgi:hypothetical protein